MKVIVLGLRAFPNVPGGVETHAQNLYPILAEKGVDVTIIVRKPYWRYAYGRLEWKGVKFKPIWAPKIKGVEALIHSCLGVLWAAFNRPDILHIHAVGSGLLVPLAKILGMKVVMTHHGPDYERQKWGSFARNLLKLGEYLGVNFSDKVIVISKVIEADLKNKFKKNNLVLIPNGVAISNRTDNDQALIKYNVINKKYILFVGRLVPEKRHIDLITAFKKTKPVDWKLVFVGGSDNPDGYESTVVEAAKTDQDIILTGKISDEELAQLYSHAGLFIFPTAVEGHPIAVLEAMSYGLPVILSDIPAHLEIDLPKESYFKLGDIDSLSGKINYWCNRKWDNADQSQQISFVKIRYNWDNTAEKTLHVYSEVMDNRSMIK